MFEPMPEIPKKLFKEKNKKESYKYVCNDCGGTVIHNEYGDKECSRCGKISIL